MKRIAILGSTGSIGVNTLKVISHFPDRFRVIGLTTNSNIELLSKQIKEFKPRFVCVSDNKAGFALRKKLNTANTKLFIGAQGLEALVSIKDIDKIVLAISGAAALLPLLKALERGKEVALANKEALVMAGPLIMDLARKKKTKIIPVDSEQSAIWQCLGEEPRSRLKHIYLTASGGPFRTVSPAALKSISISTVLRHPKWKMGKKISVDSATLMNKGLELLETMFLFGIPSEKIKILIHPQALIHSMVEFIDGIVLAQLSSTDMRIPIQYALSYPQRISNSLPVIDFYKLQELHFAKPDFKRFPCLNLAYRAARELGTMPCVLNAANEVVVSEFLGKRLGFISIPKVIERVMDRHRSKLSPHLSDILAADKWAREEAYKAIRAI
ncbi:MAG: 1-deoxy-D-xylulose-5-phosphate reductoisomerase [Candidatus Omnitrophica bacterium]|nr:1-deoxy-D-xylulose-5-phosphate reductoisomerase [Candidatus Omnitrophota bacterium]MDD5238323.1 1-deoxy-D-xylulose-5-phosphate reductoisomerase [Candidatus Omnitrophota bacterium]